MKTFIATTITAAVIALAVPVSAPATAQAATLGLAAPHVNGTIVNFCPAVGGPPPVAYGFKAVLIRDPAGCYRWVVMRVNLLP